MLFLLNADNINEPSKIYPQSFRETLLLCEGFNDSIFPPSGWQANIIMGTYNWGRYISGSNPSCQPYEGSGMAGVRLYMAPVMNAARLITPPIILGSTVTSCSLKFYMMHDPGYATAPDSIIIETSANGTNFNRITAYNRYSPTQGWVEHTVYLGNLSGTIYIGFLAYWGSGNNIYIDYVRLVGVPHSPSYIDIGIDTIISPGAIHRVNIAIPIIARLRRYSGGGPPSFPAICSIVGTNGALRYTNTQTVIWQEPLDTTRITFASWTPTTMELCTVKVRIIYPDSNPLNNRKTRTTLIYMPWLYEGFNDVTFPPLGWQAVIGSGTYNWQRSTAGTYPTCTPYEGAGMATYPSFSASAGNWARLISPPIDFGSTPVSALLNFYMMHDPGYPGPTYGPDSVKIEYSTDGINFTRIAAFRRYEPITEWRLHTIVFNAISGIVYIGFLGLSEYGNNMYIDDVQFPVQIHHDVGVDLIIYPQATHLVNTTMIPIARVRNFSHHEETNFPVVCSIIGANGALRYTNTQYVSSLGMGATTQVNFSAWTPTVAELCTVKMRTNLSIDQNPLNDRTIRTTLIQPYLLIEGFNDTIFPPSGWQSVIVQGIYNWYRATGDTGPYPSIPPYEGAGMACYPSFYAPAGSQARLITPLITPTSPWRCTLKFYMYHDPGYTGLTDSVKIETSTDGLNFTRITAFAHYGAITAWLEHSIYLGTFSVPFYVGFLGFSGHGENNNIDFVRLSAFSGIAEDKINNIPIITMLNPARPNPITNGACHLSFTLAEPSQVSLKIFDASGRLVKILVDEFKSSGVYTVNWDGRDDTKRKVAEGIYFYTLETPNQNFTKKLVLMK